MPSGFKTSDNKDLDDRYVSFESDQTLSEEQKNKAKSNLGIPEGNSLTEENLIQILSELIVENGGTLSEEE